MASTRRIHGNLPFQALPRCGQIRSRQSACQDICRSRALINASRRKRISKGSGRSVQEVNRLIKQFDEMKKMMKQMSGLAGAPGAGKKKKLKLPGMDSLFKM